MKRKTKKEKFLISATLEVKCERVVIAKDLEDALEQAIEMDDGEWLAHAIGPARVEDHDAWPEFDGQDSEVANG